MLCFLTEELTPQEADEFCTNVDGQKRIRTNTAHKTSSL